jgi:hypothetical protein
MPEHGKPFIFGARVAPLPGYDAARCGEAVGLAETLQVQAPQRLNAWISGKIPFPLQ